MDQTRTEPVPAPAPAPVRLASGGAAREAWPLDDAVVHLNHGSFGAVPTAVVRHQDELRRQADLSPVGWFPHAPELIAAARQEVAPFVGARAEDTAFVPNASAAATVVLNALRLEPGDEILVTDHGYGAITMGAHRLARRFGARVRTVAVPLAATADEVVERFRVELTDAVRLVVVDQITAAVAGADWWFGNLHKWPCAPRGSALLVTRAADRDDLWPLIDSWGAEDPYPERFDSQGTLDTTGYIASPRSIELIEREYGWARARETMAALADHGATVIGAALQPYVEGPVDTDVGMPVPSMRLLRLPDGLGRDRTDADELRRRLLDLAGVESAFTSAAGVGYLRLSVHLYTEPRDFDAFVERAVPRILAFAEERRGR
jgi:isopenicillin-N epimerase